MPEPEYGPEQELGPKLADAFQTQADTVSGRRGRVMAAEARRRIRKRRQTLVAGCCGRSGRSSHRRGVERHWQPVTGRDECKRQQGRAARPALGPTMPPVRAWHERLPGGAPDLSQGDNGGPAAGTGLDLAMPVYGLQACRYRLTPGATDAAGLWRASTRLRPSGSSTTSRCCPSGIPTCRCSSARRQRPSRPRPSCCASTRARGWCGRSGSSTTAVARSASSPEAGRTGCTPPPLRLFMTGTLRPTRWHLPEWPPGLVAITVRGRLGWAVRLGAWVMWMWRGSGSSCRTDGCCSTTSPSGSGTAPRSRWSARTGPARPR